MTADLHSNQLTERSMQGAVSNAHACGSSAELNVVQASAASHAYERYNAQAVCRCGGLISLLMVANRDIISESTFRPEAIGCLDVVSNAIHH